MKVQEIIFGMRNDQALKPGDPAMVRFRAGTRRKERPIWRRPTREEYEAYLCRTGRMEDPWGRLHTVLEALPETEPVWRDVPGFRVVLLDGNQVRVRHDRTGAAFWVARGRVWTPGRYRIHDVGEYDRWSTVDLTDPLNAGSHIHVEATDDVEIGAKEN